MNGVNCGGCGCRVIDARDVGASRMPEHRKGAFDCRSLRVTDEMRQSVLAGEAYFMRRMRDSLRRNLAFVPEKA